MTLNKQDVIVLGGGVAGIEFITRAARKDKNKQFNFILIDKNPLHIWKPMLHTFAAGSQFPSEQSIPLLTQAKRYGYLYQPGEVNDINPLEKRSHLHPIVMHKIQRFFLNAHYIMIT